MVFRYARHTEDLLRMELFYTRVVGLDKLGEFENHQGYNGIILGLAGIDWQLEFTTSSQKPQRKFDDDDTLVFYLRTEDEFIGARKRIADSGVSTEIPRNPYWSANGIMISDPDGHHVIFTQLRSK